MEDEIGVQLVSILLKDMLGKVHSHVPPHLKSFSEDHRPGKLQVNQSQRSNVADKFLNAFSTLKIYLPQIVNIMLYSGRFQQYEP